MELSLFQKTGVIGYKYSPLHTTAAIRSAPHSLRSLRCSGFATFFLRLPSAYSAQKKRRIAANVRRNATHMTLKEKRLNGLLVAQRVAYGFSSVVALYLVVELSIYFISFGRLQFNSLLEIHRSIPIYLLATVLAAVTISKTLKAIPLYCALLGLAISLGFLISWLITLIPPAAELCASESQCMALQQLSRLALEKWRNTALAAIMAHSSLLLTSIMRWLYFRWHFA